MAKLLNYTSQGSDRWDLSICVLEPCFGNELVAYRGKVALLPVQGGVLGPDVPRFK